MSDTPPVGSSPGALSRSAPVARFLGEAGGAGGPFAILRLAAGALTDEEIIAGLDAQLARLAAHVECNTPQADEVRLALHAAAAQLLDPGVRAHLVARWGVEGAAAPRAERRESPVAASAHVALEHDAVLTLATLGGWNKRSLRRLMALSAARGLGAAELVDALRGMGAGVGRAVPARGGAGPRAGARPGPVLTRLATPLSPAGGLPAGETGGAAGPTTPLPEQIDPAARVLKIVLACAAAVLVLVVLSLGALVLAARRPASPATVVPVAPKRTAVAPPVVAESAPAAAAPEQAPDIEVVTRELAASVAGVAADPGVAVGRFERSVAALSAGWPALAADQMVAAQHQVIEFVYRAAPTGEAGSRAVEAVASGATVLAGGAPITAEMVRPAVWSAGMLNRLARENDLPTGLEQQIDARLNAALGSRRPAGDPTFEAGAGAAVQVIPTILARAAGPGAGSAPDPARTAALVEAWRRWLDAAGRVARDDAARDRFVLGGLQTLLVDGPDPVADEAAFKVVRMIVGRLTWRPGDDSRAWLLRWFDDSRITSGDLYAVTSAVATGSSAESVNATMVVPVMASGSVRAEMRDVYGRAWGLSGGPDRAEIIRRLADAADKALAQDDPGGPLTEVLGRAVVLSRLSEAAWWAWRGQAEQAAAILTRLDADVASGTPGTQQGAGGGGRDVGARRSGSVWSARYLTARKNIVLRLDLLGQLTNESLLDSMGAELLASDALRGTPFEVRKQASDRLVQFGDSPLVVNAVLEELPTAPATVANLHLIESVALARLPGPGDPGWRLEARRALVERLLQAVASEGDLAAIDRETEMLARSFEGRVRETPAADDVGASGGSGGAPPPAAEVSAAYLYRQWQSKVDPSLPPPAGLPPPEEIEHRRAGRAALARGMVQAFAAQEVSACELMAYVVGAERAGEAPRVAAALSGLVEARQRARHIFEQVRATEAVTLRLWLIRLGREQQS